MNSHINTTMKIMIPLGCCFNNIQLLMLTKFIIHILLLNGNLTCTRQITKISRIWVFKCLLKRVNYLKTWMYTIGQNDYLMKLIGPNSKAFWNTNIFMQRAIIYFFIHYWEYYIYILIRLWYDNGCNAKVVCIKYNSCEINMTY